MIEKLENTIKKTLPSPFSIAIILTIIIILFSVFLTDNSIINILTYWEKGLWNNSLMNFAMQMMLMLVLGYVLALTESSKKIIDKITHLCHNSAHAAFWVSFSTILVSFFNWGLGLIFGAILTRKVGEHAIEKNIQINYPLIGAAGYSGLMVWHGGFSGSIPLKIAEKEHLKDIINKPEILEKLPESGIDFSQTVFSHMNLSVSLLLITIIPLVLFYVGKKKPNGAKIKFKTTKITQQKTTFIGAEKIDNSKLFSKMVGMIIVLLAIRKAYIADSFSFINPNFINFLLLGLCLFLHKNFNYFIKSVNSAISSASGILIQFPLYFGIMGIMNSTGLVDIFADFFVNISNKNTYPIFTMLSGGIVNIFVPSGGGQWAVQGIIVIQSALELGVSIPKSIMALVYGDQLTNMLQPFWALPLLGITQLKAKELLPYTLIIMFIGIIIFSINLIIF